MFKTETFEGFNAYIIQHEIDHLNGITCIDREYKREPLKVGTKIGRNEPCPCGSGKKYKKCHMGK